MTEIMSLAVQLMRVESSHCFGEPQEFAEVIMG